MPSDVNESKRYALLSYCFILCIIPLIRKKDDVFVQFHARQGLALFLCEMAAFIISIVFPFLMKPALFIFGSLSLWGMLKAIRGEEFPLPFIHPLSQKLDI
jgi:fumarate reductase subunit D